MSTKRGETTGTPDEIQLTKGRQSLVDFLQTSIGKLAPIIKPRLTNQPGDCLFYEDELVLIARQVEQSLRRALGILRNLLMRDSYVRFFYPNPDRSTPSQDSFPGQENPRYILTRLMFKLIEVIKISPVGQLKEDVIACIDAFAKQDPGFRINIEKNFLNRVEKVEMAERDNS